MQPENLADLEAQYLQAKEAYYLGEPVMTDDEFDRLEEALRAAGSAVVDIVGAPGRKDRFTHPTPMLSLAKVQATLAGDPPADGFARWAATLPSRGSSLVATPKFDGNAANCIYVDGSLVRVLSRGDSRGGRDITAKVRHLIPARVPAEGTLEVRGEVVMAIQDFNDNFAAFKNPRNFVAGCLNRDDDTHGAWPHLRFVAFEARTDAGADDEVLLLSRWGFETPFFIRFGADEFSAAYESMRSYREECAYQLDGFVVKATADDRAALGETDHHPNWALAVKFPPKEAATVIESIIWNTGKTRELTPIAQMRPVLLDGSEVRRASLHNWGIVQQQGLCPGAEVVIAKKGDIIPQVIRVTRPVRGCAPPAACPACGAPTLVDGVHLMCSNDSCAGSGARRLGYGVGALQLDGFGGAVIAKLHAAGLRTAFDLFDPRKFSREALTASGQFTEGRTLEKLLEEVAAVREVPLQKAVLMMAVENAGHTISGQVARWLSNLPADWKGLDRSVVAQFVTESGAPGPAAQVLVAEVERLRANGITVSPVAADPAGTGFEMTGSPKEFGFKTKEEFLRACADRGYVHAALGKGAQYLVTDSVSSTSSKMAKAAKLGVPVLTYDNFMEMINA